MKRHFDSLLSRLGLGGQGAEEAEAAPGATTARIPDFRARAYSNGGPLMDGLNLKEAVKQAHAWSYDLTAETAVACRMGKNPRPEQPDWAVVLVDDFDEQAWNADSKVRFNNGHAHPECPWQLHHSKSDDPYQA